MRAGGAGRKALNRAAFLLYGKRNACSELSLAGRTDRWNFRAACASATGRKPTSAQVGKLEREYLKHLPYYVRRAIGSKNYILPPGIKPLLKRLSREKEILLGLGTGNMERGARIKLEPSGFNSYFLFGGFGADGLHRVHLLKKAVARAKKFMNGHAGSVEVFVIGDTPHDVSAGKKAGYKTVAVGTGYASWEDLVQAKPDYLARDFRGMSKWLKWFGIK